ncbi:hypothetical protein IPZ58_11855 [Streptomyces roseoverticillatus]|uniref:hypothetical protein n=1 Tax=Streptomyces roseoverticillatus TaxID=66429 RepID=UPI001F2D7117|nr:hypothetical protein [Streptomyces roseoverticillatus]MCF3102278.1 hypothetical protein [Streptomyces roseoverticillatus]
MRTGVGSAVVVWGGDPEDAGGEHHVEWTVDDDITWSGNTVPAASASPALEEADDCIVFRGQLSLTDDGTASLYFAGTHILFDLADPPPPKGTDGTWVELRVKRDHVSLWPYQL